MPIEGNPDFSIEVEETGIFGATKDNGLPANNSLRKEYVKTWFWKEDEDTFSYVSISFLDGTSLPNLITTISFKRSDVLNEKGYCSVTEAPDKYVNGLASQETVKSNVLYLSISPIENPFKIVDYYRNGKTISNTTMKTVLDLSDTDTKKSLTMARDVLGLSPLETVLDSCITNDVIVELCINRYKGSLISTVLRPSGKTVIYKAELELKELNPSVKFITLIKNNISKITIADKKDASDYHKMIISFRNEQKIISRKPNKTVEEVSKKEFELYFCSKEAAEKFKKEIGGQAEINANLANVIDKASGDSPLITAFKAKDYVEAKELIIDGADVIYKNPKTGFSTLRYAVDADDLESIKKIMSSPAMSGEILEKNLSNIQDDFLYALEQGKVEAVGIMGWSGRRKYNITNSKGYYPAMVAYQLGKIETCKSLLNLYSNPYKGNYIGFQQQSTNEKMTLLMMAAEKNDITTIKKLELLENDKDSELMNKDGYTAMMLAAENGCQEVIEWAIEKGYQRIWKFQSTQGKMKGKTPIDVAKTKEIKKLIKIASEK